jgi:hypothetical protein
LAEPAHAQGGNVKEREQGGQRKDNLPEVPVFFQNPFTFSKKACVFFHQLALAKL